MNSLSGRMNMRIEKNIDENDTKRRIQLCVKIKKRCYTDLLHFSTRKHNFFQEKTLGDISFKLETKIMIFMSVLIKLNTEFNAIGSGNWEGINFNHRSFQISMFYRTFGPIYILKSSVLLHFCQFTQVLFMIHQKDAELAKMVGPVGPNN
jgi:hypothetical protein